MTIATNNPVTTPAQDAQTYDTWWISDMYVNAETPATGISVTVKFQLCYVDENGLPVFCPNSNPVLMNVPDIYAVAAADNTGVVASAMQSIITACGQVGMEQGDIN